MIMCLIYSKKKNDHLYNFFNKFFFFWGKTLNCECVLKLVVFFSPPPFCFQLLQNCRQTLMSWRVIWTGPEFPIWTTAHMPWECYSPASRTILCSESWRWAAVYVKRIYFINTFLLTSCANQVQHDAHFCAMWHNHRQSDWIFNLQLFETGF